MSRKCKILGLVSTAVLALSALGASAASAAEFHANAAPTTLTGAQTTVHVLTTTSGTVTCKPTAFSGTMATTTSTAITLTPNYDNCTAFGFVGIPIHENGCAFVLHENGTTEIECPAGKEIEITVPGCTNTIGPQHLAVGGNTFSNSAEKTDISIKTSISGLNYRECGGALQTTGSYVGTTTLTGSSNIAYGATPKPTEFHAHSAPTTLAGTQTTSHVFTMTSGTGTCKTVAFSGTMATTTTTLITLTPNYDNCTFFGFIAVPIHENGCAFVLHENGTTEIECPAGKEIEITVPGCTNTIGPQHLPSGISFENNAEGTDITISTNISGIKYRECGGALQTNATYTGTSTVIGSASIWWG